MIVPTKITLALDRVKSIEQHLTAIEAATLALHVFTTCKQDESVGEIKIEGDESMGERDAKSMIAEILELCELKGMDHRPSKLTYIINETNVWNGSAFKERHIYYIRKFIKKSAKEYVTKFCEINDVFGIIMKMLMDYKEKRIRDINELFKETWDKEGWGGDTKSVRPVSEYEWRSPLSDVASIVGEMYENLYYVNDSEYEEDPDDPFPW